ncbi:octopamine receptor-like [Dreissena polymorpha]|nr:octopamine receptor-like [Dreissena polymorpha]
MITLVTSVMSLCNISINRYVMVCYPQKFKDIYTVRNSVLMILGVAIFSILLSLPPLLGWSEYVYTPSHSFCFADWQNHMSYAFFMIGCCFGIPLMVMTVCNVFILRTVKFSRLRVKASSITRKRSTFGTQSENKSTEPNLSSLKRFTFNMSSLRSTTENKTKTAATEAPLVSNNKSTLNKEPNKEYQGVAKTLCSIDLESMSATAVNLNPLHNTLISSSLKVPVTSAALHTPSYKSPNSTLTHKPRNRLLHPNGKHSSAEQHSSRGSPEPSISIEPSSDVLLVIPSNSEMEINGQGSENKVHTKLPKLRKSSSKRREEIRLAFSLIIVVLVFVVCWLPYCISMLLSIFYLGHVPREFHMFTIIIGYANSGCNPIIYGVMNKRFKVGFLHIFCFWKDRNSSNFSCS